MGLSGDLKMLQIKILASGSSGNCCRVKDGQTTILIDCGITTTKIKEGLDYQLGGVGGVLITHRHL